MTRVRPVASFLAALFLAATSIAATPARPAPPAAPALGRAVDAWLAPLVAAGHFAGQVVVSRDGHVLVDRAYGLAQREFAVPMTPGTRINIASITKPMTVIVLTRLVEQHRLALTDTLGKWIPGFPAGDRITIDMLLRHRAGIPHRVTDEKEESQLLAPADVVALARTKPLLFEPGTSSSYSSAGFTVLARVLELAAGEPYGALVRRYVFAPAHLAHSFNADDRALQPLRAPSYLPGAHGIENAPLKDLSFLAGAGSVFSTARDLDRFGRAIVDGTYGPGPRQSWVRGGRMFLNGSTNGYRAFVDYDSTTGVMISVCANVHTGVVDLMRPAIARLAAGESVASPALPAAALDPIAHRAAVDPAVMRRIEGAYQLGNGTRLDLRMQDGLMQANDWVLVPTSDSTFFSLRDYGDVTAVRDGAGAFVRLDWTVAGQKWPAPRVGDAAR